MAVKRAIFEREPWVIINILKAFNQANEIAESERREHVAYHIETGLVPAEYRKALATALITHGLKANRAVLETAAKFSNQQGLTPRVMPMNELFAVNALDSALRAALAKSFPKLKKVTLTDYKVRILDGFAGTAAKTRVLIESTDGRREWGTVGVSENIIEASLQALVDSMEFALLKK